MPLGTFAGTASPQTVPPTPPAPPFAPEPPQPPPWPPKLYGSNDFADSLDDPEYRRASYQAFASQYESATCSPTGRFGSATVHNVKPYRLKVVVCRGDAQTDPDGSSRMWVYYRLDGLPSHFARGAELTFQFSLEPRHAPSHLASAFYMGPAPTAGLNANPPIYLHHEHARRRDRSELPHAAGDTKELNFQAHGDSLCTEADGGAACLVYELPTPHVWRVNPNAYDIDGVYVVTSSLRDPLRPMIAFRHLLPTTSSSNASAVRAAPPLVPITHFTATLPDGANIYRVWQSVYVTWFTFELPFAAYIKYAFLHTHMRAFGGLWAFANSPASLGLDSAPTYALSLPDYLLDVHSAAGLAALLAHVRQQRGAEEICQVDEAAMQARTDKSVPANLDWWPEGSFANRSRGGGSDGSGAAAMLTDKKVFLRCTQRRLAARTAVTVLGAFQVGKVIHDDPDMFALLTASDGGKPLFVTQPFFEHLGLRLLLHADGDEIQIGDDTARATEPQGTCAPSTVRAYVPSSPFWRWRTGSNGSWTEKRKPYC